MKHAHQHQHQHQHHHVPPCLHCHPHSYIRMVQNLIERCLLLHMSREQCIKALAEHASIRPLITLTVWRELQKENRDFFQSYFHSERYPINNRRLYIHQTGPRVARRDNRRKWH